MTPWKKIKTSTNAAEKLERLQGVASEPGLTTDNIGFENQLQEKLRAARAKKRRGLKNVRPSGKK